MINQIIINENPMLSKAQIIELITDWQVNKNKDSLDKIVLSHVRLIIKEVGKIKGLATEDDNFKEDLFQEGFIGLLKAADKFDKEYGVRFTTYASLWIRSKLREYLMAHHSMIRFTSTRTGRQLFSNYFQSRNDAEKLGLGKSKVNKRISEDFGISESEAARAGVMLRFGDKSMDDFAGSNGSASYQRSPSSCSRFSDTIADPVFGERYVSGKIISTQILNIIHDNLSLLTEVERKILQERYLTDSPKTLRQLESKLPWSREQIRKIQSKATNKIRKRYDV